MYHRPVLWLPPAARPPRVALCVLLPCKSLPCCPVLHGSLQVMELLAESQAALQAKQQELDEVRAEVRGGC